jgi:predicted CxxxxCH...CXXCH cytochrome family protein
MCHAVTVSSAATNDIAPAAVDSHANHVNVTADIDFHASVSGGAGLGYTAGNDGEGTCSEVGCHSSGQATPTYRTPAWNNNPSNVCMYCHGSEGGGVAGEPRYENGGAGFQINDSNSHPAHVGSASDCANCHNDTTTTANTITTPANHLDGNRQVAIATAYEDTPGSFTYDTDNKTCGGLNGLTCHASKQWGGAKLVCLDCHDGAGADTDSWVYNDGTKSAINLNEWTESGHGRTTGNYPGTNSPPANFAGPNPCLYCHTGTVGHNNGNNIFRLRNVGAASSPTDFAGVCLACHGDSSSGVDPDVDDGVAGDQYTPINGTEKVNSYHFGDKHSGNEGGQFCWDCHDPHGDRDSGSGNIAMLHDQVTQVSNGVNGIPVTQVTVTFTQITGLEDYVERGEPIASPPSTKLCNTCHTDSSLHFTQTKGDGHKLGDPDSKGSCAAADCHEHDRPEANTAFGKPLGGPLDCLSAGCHDQAINGSGGPYGDGTYTRRAVTASGDFANTTGGGDTRSHHVGNAGTNMGGAVTNLDCIVCHAEGSYTGSPIPTGTAYHLNRTIDLYDADDTNNVFSYDVDRIRYGPSGAGTDPSAWNSSNPDVAAHDHQRLAADITVGQGPRPLLHQLSRRRRRRRNLQSGDPPGLEPGDRELQPLRRRRHHQRVRPEAALRTAGPGGRRAAAHPGSDEGHRRQEPGARASIVYGPHTQPHSGPRSGRRRPGRPAERSVCTPRDPRHGAQPIQAVPVAAQRVLDLGAPGRRERKRSHADGPHRTEPGWTELLRQ